MVRDWHLLPGFPALNLMQDCSPKDKCSEFLSAYVSSVTLGYTTTCSIVYLDSTMLSPEGVGGDRKPWR